jgi:hypothetical protein
MKQKSLYRLTAAVEKKEFFFFFGDQQAREMYKKRFCGKLFVAKVELSHGIAAFRDGDKPGTKQPCQAQQKA